MWSNTFDQPLGQRAFLLKISISQYYNTCHYTRFVLWRGFRTILYIMTTLLRFERNDLILCNLNKYYILLFYCTYLTYLLFYYFMLYTRIGVPVFNDNNYIICILHVREEFNRIIISNVPTQHIHPYPHPSMIYASYERARGK